MACCGAPCGTGCGGGYGGAGASAGNGGVLVDTGSTTDVHVQPGGCSLTIPGPRLISYGDARVCCRCVCASECCMPSGGTSGGGRGGYGPGLRVDIGYPGYEVILPGGFLCSTAHCGKVGTSCCDPCCGPC